MARRVILRQAQGDILLVILNLSFQPDLVEGWQFACHIELLVSA